MAGWCPLCITSSWIPQPAPIACTFRSFSLPVADFLRCHAYTQGFRTAKDFTPLSLLCLQMNCAAAKPGCAKPGGDGCSCELCSNGYIAGRAGSCDKVRLTAPSAVTEIVSILRVNAPAQQQNRVRHSLPKVTPLPHGLQCPTIANCTTYSPVNCTCTECGQGEMHGQQ